MTKSEKLQATYQLKREQAAQRKAERAAQIKALQEIRDDPDTSPSDRLRAVELLISEFSH